MSDRQEVGISFQIGRSWLTGSGLAKCARLSPYLLGCGSVGPDRDSAAASCPRLTDPSPLSPQAQRSCHHWSTGTPLGTEDPPQPGPKCWLSVEVTAMRTSDSAAGVVAAARQWAEMTAQTTSSYGGCDLSSMAWDLAAHLPSACLPLPNPHADSAQECPTRGTPVPHGLLPFSRKHSDGTPAGHRATAFPDPLAAPVLPVMMGAGWGA